MITFLNRLLEKGGSWIMTILLAVIVIAFVFTIGASPGLTEKEKGLGDMDYYGVDFSPTSKARRAVFQRAEIQATMEMGQYLNNPQFARFAPQLISRQTQSNALDNLPLARIANRLGLPKAKKQEIDAYIMKQGLFQESIPGKQPRYSKNEVDKFETRLKVTGADQQFEPAVKEAILVGKLQQVLRGPGTTLPFEAVAKVRSDETQWSVGLVTLEQKKGESEIGDPNDDALKSLYELTQDEYTTEETRKVSYIVFDAEQAHPTTAQLKTYYEKHSARYLPEEQAAEQDPKEEADKDGKKATEGEKKAKPKETPAYETLAYEIHRDVLDDYLVDNKTILEAGMKKAAEKAEDLLNTLYNDANFLSMEQGIAILKEKGITRHSHLAPYAADAPPKASFLRDLNAPFVDHSPSDTENTRAGKLLDNAFNLSNDRFHSEAYEIGSRYVILWLEEIQESKAPSFEELKKSKTNFDKLVAEWRKRETDKAFSTKRGEVEIALKASLNASKSLEESAKSADPGKGWSLTHTTHEDFKASSLPEDLLPEVFDAAKELAKDESSAMEVVEGKGYMVTVLSRKVPGYTMENSEVKQELKRLQRSSAGGSVTQELRSRGLAGMKVNLFDSPGN